MSKPDDPYVVLARSSESPAIEPRPIDAGYDVTLWRPSLTAVHPAAFPGHWVHVWLYWLTHHLRGFQNRDYSILLISAGGRIVHRSFVFPRYFTFPFMQKQDLQLGNTWTDPDHRGRGLATHAISEAMRLHAAPGRTFWYVAERSNDSSVRAARTAGMSAVGSAVHHTPFGVSAVGHYELVPAKMNAVSLLRG